MTYYFVLIISFGLGEDPGRKDITVEIFLKKYNEKKIYERKSFNKFFHCLYFLSG